MANLHDENAVTSSAAELQKDAERPGFLQKIKDKLHIGDHHKSHEEDVPSQATTDSVAVSSKSVTGAAVSTPPPVKEAESAVARPVEATPAPVTSHVQPEGQHHGYPTPDLNSLVGHEAEHHGGVPTFLVALPDQDIPTKDIPDEMNKETSSDVSAVPTKEQHYSAQDKEVHSDEMFSNAQREHHGGVPTFLVALPDEEIPEEVNKGVSESDTTVGEERLSGDFGVEQFDSEDVFSKAQQGEHYEGVPTFLVALPDQDIPDEVTKGVDATAAPASSINTALEGSLHK